LSLKDYNMEFKAFRLGNILRFLRSSDTAFLFFISLVVGLGGGYGAVAFRWMIDNFYLIFFEGGKLMTPFLGEYYVILLPATGGLIVGLIIYFFARETKGHGVPEVMYAVSLKGGIIRSRVALIKALVSSIYIGAGGSVGREGPIVQIGSSMGSTLGQWFKLTKTKTRVLVACGAASGIAATFNTPLAGIFFSLEVILRNYSPRYFASIILSAVVGTVVSRYYLGNIPAFVTPGYELKSIWAFLLYLVLGFASGLIALLYTKTLYAFEDLFEEIKIVDYIKPVFGGLIIGVIGFYFPQIYGVSYEALEEALNQGLPWKLALILLFLKILATSISIGSGGSGGVFAPGLFIGAMFGVVFNHITQAFFPEIATAPGADALLGMGAVFAGTAQAPISAILILFEMTGNYEIILPLITVCVISTLTFRRFSAYSIYTLKIKRMGINMNALVNLNLLEDIKVSEAMSYPVVTLSPDNSITEAGLTVKRTRHRGFPVVDKDDKLVGILTHKDINKYLFTDRGEDKIDTIMTTDLITCHPDDTLRRALEKFGRKNIGRAPVVEKGKEDTLLGLITRKNIIAACHEAIKKRDAEIYLDKEQHLKKSANPRV